MKSFSQVRLFATPCTAGSKEDWSGLSFPSPEDLPNSGIEPGSPALQADTLPSKPPGKPKCPISEYLSSINQFIYRLMIYNSPKQFH